MKNLVIVAALAAAMGASVAFAGENNTANATLNNSGNVTVTGASGTVEAQTKWKLGSAQANVDAKGQGVVINNDQSNGNNNTFNGTLSNSGNVTVTGGQGVAINNKQ